MLKRSAILSILLIMFALSTTEGESLRKGNIFVTCEAGASIYVNDVLKGASKGRDKEFKVKKISIGIYTVKITKEGFLPREKRVKVNWNKTSRVTFKDLLPKPKMGKEAYELRMKPALRKEAVKKYGGNEDSEKAIDLGLKWLADNQDKNGRWDAKRWGGTQRVDAGITGLALLAFLGRGNSELVGPYKDTVKAGIEWLTNKQESNGSLACGYTTYNHAIAAIAMLENVSIGCSTESAKAAEKALKYTLESQNKGMAWRYWPSDGTNDTSVTSWCSAVLYAAIRANMKVPEDSLNGVNTYLNAVTEPMTGEIGYRRKPTKPVAEVWQKFSMTACGLDSRLKILMDFDGSGDQIEKGIKILQDNPPEWTQPGLNSPFFYYWYFGSQVMFQYGDEPWESWNKKMRDMLVQNQITEDGVAKGAWKHPGNTMYGMTGGVIYATAMSILILESYYRFPKTYVPSPKEEDIKKD